MCFRLRHGMRRVRRVRVKRSLFWSLKADGRRKLPALGRAADPARPLFKEGEMMKRFLNSAAAGAIFALAALATTATALVVTGRISANNREIFQVGIAAVTPEQGITATASGTQATSYQLSAGVSFVTTVATIGDGVRLPSITAIGPPTNLDGSLNVIVVNNTANSMNVFPFLATDVIVSNGVAAGAGAALAIAALKSADCWASTALGRWYCTVG